MISASSIDSDLSGRHVIIGGTSENENIYFAACQTINGLKMVAVMDVSENKYGRPFKIKRMSGHDIFAVGCAKHILMIKFTNNRLHLVKSFLDVHSDLIYDLCVVKNMIFSKGRGESFIRVIYFGDQFNTVAKVKEESVFTKVPAEINSPNLLNNQERTSHSTISRFEVPMCNIL